MPARIRRPRIRRGAGRRAGVRILAVWCVRCLGRCSRVWYPRRQVQWSVHSGGFRAIGVRRCCWWRGRRGTCRLLRLFHPGRRLRVSGLGSGRIGSMRRVRRRIVLRVCRCRGTTVCCRGWVACLRLPLWRFRPRRARLSCLRWWCRRGVRWFRGLLVRRGCS